MVAVHVVKHSETVHARHDDIQKDQRKACSVFFQQTQALFAGGSLDDIVFILQNLREEIRFISESSTIRMRCFSLRFS